MLKRPILFLFAAFLAGEFSYYLKNPQGFWILFFFLCFLDILSLFLHVYSKWLYPQDKILLLIPVLFLIGYTRMQSVNQTYPVETVFEDSVDCTVFGTVTKVGTNGEYLKLTIKDCVVMIEDNSFEGGKILVTSEAEEDYHIGNEITCSGTLKKFSEPGNPGQFDEAKYYKILGYQYKIFAESVQCTNQQVSWFWDNTSKLKNRMLASYRAILNDEDYGLIAAMLLGESSEMNADLKELYQKNGISHILAISGVCTLSLASLRPP